jgi:hypothetical protein
VPIQALAPFLGRAATLTSQNVAGNGAQVLPSPFSPPPRGDSPISSGHCYTSGGDYCAPGCRLLSSSVQPYPQQARCGLIYSNYDPLWNRFVPTAWGGWPRNKHAGGQFLVLNGALVCFRWARFWALHRGVRCGKAQDAGPPMSLVGMRLSGMRLSRARISCGSASHDIPEGFYEYLARQNTVAYLFQLQLGFRRRRIWVSVIVAVSQRPLFRTLHGLLGYQRSSALFRPVCLSPVCPSLFCRSDWLANPIACASFPRLALPRL